MKLITYSWVRKGKLVVRFHAIGRRALIGKEISPLGSFEYVHGPIKVNANVHCLILPIATKAAPLQYGHTWCSCFFNL
jgi:hypothetical protein